MGGKTGLERRYPHAYLDYLVHFHGDRDYFECHEILEEYWKEHPDSPFRPTWVGLIQAAVGMYHYRRGNVPGAIKSLSGAIVRSDPFHLGKLGIDAPVWLRMLQDTLNGLQSTSVPPYQDVNMPIADTELAEACKELCQERGLEWGAASPMDDPELIHRHTLRDRTDVIRERQNAIEVRRQSSP